MITQFLLQTYAKLNLSLLVYSPRKDRLHPICSVFQAIQLCDDLVISIDPCRSGFSLLCDHPLVPTDSENFLARIYHQLMAFIPDGIHIDLKKHIPVGAGLGGGSSNAAGLLAFLISYYQIPFSVARIQSIARRIGADVPFFLGSSPALVRGIGDRLTFLPKGLYRYFVIIYPQIVSSTREVYQAFDQLHGFEVLVPRRTPSYILDEHIGPNDLKPVVFHMFSEMERIESDILAFGAPEVFMSGSGSTLFVPFYENDRSEADDLCDRLRQRFPAFHIGVYEAMDRGYQFSRISG